LGEIVFFIWRIEPPVTYRVPFIVSQQRVNQSFIKLNEEIIQLKRELKLRSEDYMKKKYANIEPEGVEIAVNDVLKSVMGKINSKVITNIQFFIKISHMLKKICVITVSSFVPITKDHLKKSFANFAKLFFY